MRTSVTLAGAALLVAGGCLYAGMAPSSQIFGPTLVSGRDPDEFALTYDDGPNGGTTERLLEILERHNVHAAFFVIGRFTREQAGLLRRMRASGHIIGNHTWTHPVLMWRSTARIREELSSTSAALEDILGERIRYFRPPHGARRPVVLREARELGLTPVLWNAMGFDWKPTTPERVLRNLARGIRRNRRHRRGSTLLLHDGSQAGVGADREPTLQATETLLETWDGRVRFVRISDWDESANPPEISAGEAAPAQP